MEKDVLMVTFNLKEMDMQEANHMFNYLKESFPKKNVVMVPDIVTITELTKEELIQVRDRLTSYIESIK